VEIEIVTTKRKITKSLVGQMRRADGSKNMAFWGGEPLGFLVGIVKDIYKALLIKYQDDFYVLPMNYSLGELCVTRSFGRWHQSIKFETSEEKIDWWNRYQVLIYGEKAQQQIYI